MEQGSGSGAFTANGRCRMLAFSEQKLNPSVFVYSYPELSLRCELKGVSLFIQSEGFRFVCFLETYWWNFCLKNNCNVHLVNMKILTFCFRFCIDYTECKAILMCDSCHL